MHSKPEFGFLSTVVPTVDSINDRHQNDWVKQDFHTQCLNMLYCFRCLILMSVPSLLVFLLLFWLEEASVEA